MNDAHMHDGDLQGMGALEPGSVHSTAMGQTDPYPATCVICLEDISEKAISVPCQHANFDFACLAAWLQRRSTCPLCKAVVSGIKYDLDAASGSQVFSLPLPQPEPVSSRRPLGRHTVRRGRQTLRGSGTPRDQQDQEQDNVLNRRRDVYRHKKYSLHVGSNRISRYQTITPQSFKQDDKLLRRARIWIRRELQVFEFLDPDSPSTESSTNVKRRARNAQFLLEYILAILKSIDIRGSTGQSEELLQEFLGRENARLFLHELENWLRSPYERLQGWDEAVQYGERGGQKTQHGSRSMS